MLNKFPIDFIISYYSYMYSYTINKNRLYDWQIIRSINLYDVALFQFSLWWIRYSFYIFLVEALRQTEKSV